MRSRLFKILIPIIIILMSAQTHAQVNDAQLWTSVNLEKKIIRQLSISLSEEVRFSENITEVGSFFTDIGLTYKFHKNWRLSGNYRFTNKIRLDNIYSKRHRYYFDLSYRKKIYHFTLMFRTRFQSQYADVNSSEDGHLAEYYSRNKITLKYNITKTIAPYMSAEAYVPLNNPGIQGIDNMRYSLGLEWEFVKNSTIDVFYMIQQEYQVKDRERDFVAGLGYYYSF